jgi:hypothetical protein
MDSSSHRWRFDVLSPLDGTIIWSYSSFSVKEIANQWERDSGNKFLSKAKINRATIGVLNCPQIKCYKIGKWADKHIVDLGKAPKLEKEFEHKNPPSPTASILTEDDSTWDSSSSDGTITDSD